MIHVYTAPCLDIVWVADHVRDGLELDKRRALGTLVHPLGVAQPLLESRLHVVDHSLREGHRRVVRYWMLSFSFSDTRHSELS